MNSMGIAQVDNLKISLEKLRKQKLFERSLALAYGMNSGTTSFILNSQSTRYTKGLTTTTLNLQDINQLRQLPFVSPYIGPMTNIIEKAKDFLPCNVSCGLSGLCELSPGLKLEL